MMMKSVFWWRKLEYPEETTGYCIENQLTINVKKTQYVIFSTGRQKDKYSGIKLRIREHNQSEVDDYKYLGTILDSKLMGKKQYNQVAGKVAVKLTTFRSIRYIINTDTTLQICKAMILSILDYNAIVFGLLTETLKKKLQTVQNRALRTVYWGNSYSTAELHSKAGVRYLNDRRKLHLLGLMYKRKGQAKYIDEMELPTRSHRGVIMKVPTPATNYMIKAPIYQGSIAWNALPVETRSIEYYDIFKCAIST